MHGHLPSLKPGGDRAVIKPNYALRATIACVACGKTLNRSPTTAKSASSRIGASGSLVMATIVLLVCMPARC